jgi:esterase/lipase
MPYLVRGRSRDIGVLLIHGYMASPLEVKALADYFGKAGYWVYAPRLRGHGTSPEDLAQRRYQDWIESVNTGYAIIRSTCRRVVLGGFSNGAGLALDLASRVRDALGVFAISPPMQLQDFSAKLVPAVDVWNRLMEKVHIEGARKKFVENHPENPHINYHRNPISGVRELERLMDQLEPKLADIRIPALVIQAMGDPVVSPDGTRKVYKKLGSRDKTYVVLNYQRHGIILGKKSERVHHIIHDFIQYLKDGQHAPPVSRPAS